jgi:type I restriction enzyme M protein
LKAAIGKPITSLFDLPRSGRGSIKTEVLFIERCLDLLKPGGRMGIVLPEGIFNNPSTTDVRHFVEDRAEISAVVSLPSDTFVASGATVKTSLLFLRKFTEAEKVKYDKLAEETLKETRAIRQEEIDLQETILASSMSKLTDYLSAKQSDAKQRVAAAEKREAFNRDLKERKKVAGTLPADHR